MREKIDCVAITDHNTGRWIDRLKDEAARMAEEQPEGFHPIHLFPGVEISVTGGIHVLAILPPEADEAVVERLLGSAGFRGEGGKSEDVTEKSFPQVVEAIHDHGGIAIPAHVDERRGLFRELDSSGTTLRQALNTEGIVAMEVRDQSAEKPGLYNELSLRWTEILGSDSHRPSGEEGRPCPSSHYTWIKMGSPNLEGLILALRDGPLSVKRSDDHPDDPNEHAPLGIETIEVRDAHYMGQAEPFRVNFSPWLNAVIGGRGTGKSTLIEFLRLGMGREDEIPAELEDEFAKYRATYPDGGDSGLLRPETELRVGYRKASGQFQLRWTPGEDGPVILEPQNGDWAEVEGAVAERFPVRIFSQKQIFHLSTQPLALLGVIDDATEVEARRLKTGLEQARNQYLSLRAQAREVEPSTEEDSRIRGELEDVKRQLKLFEELGHGEVLQAYQKRRRQETSVVNWEEKWKGLGDDLRRKAEDMAPPEMEETEFDQEQPEEANILRAIEEHRERIKGIARELERLAQQADQVFSDWQQTKEGSDWRSRVASSEREYQILQKRLEEEGAGDPAAYDQLVQRRQALEQELAELERQNKQAERLRRSASEQLVEILSWRRKLTESREEFLDEILANNPFVSIEVVPYGGTDSVEAEFREIIQKPGETFERDIGTPGGEGVLGALVVGDEVAETENSLKEVKERVRGIAEGQDTFRDPRFATHLRSLPPETLDRLDAWFPEDSLTVRYSVTGDGRNFRSINEASPGQKTAALLAFLLSYGEEPLILDQPEDDLDSHLIYDLIVKQLREVKGGRQVIVVTHHPNIVVHGDAELVLALGVGPGETVKESEGSLQNKDVRNTICQVLEGGWDAFRERYRRIAL